MGSKSAIGIGNGICFKQVRDKGGGSYIDPLVRDSIVGLWKFDQNTNESPTRNIIKNTIKDKGGDLELLNFGYKLNSGYNGYLEDFTSWKNSTNLRVEYSNDGSKCKITSENIKDWWKIAPKSGISNSFKVKITNCHFPIVWRYTDDGNTYKDINIIEDGIYNLPQSIINNEGVVNKCYFGCDSRRDDYTGLTIEQLPLYEGALVTDGKDDMIVSQKTVQEMLRGSNVCTVVSMIHQINLSTVSSITSINNIRSESVAHVYARHLNTAYGKTGIFGYSKQLNTTNNPTLINNILGDKKDYIAEGNTVIDTTDKYFVQGYLWNDSLQELSEVAVYWTFIANKVLTTDEINQIIAYYKLDKYVTPQVIYDVKRQGLTNDTPDSDWYLKDFSGNGHDMQLYNFAKKLGSGIGKYEADYSTWTKTAGVISTPFGLKITEPTHNYWILYTSNITVPAHKVKILGIPEGGEFRYLGVHILKNGINELPKMEEHPSAIGFTLHKGTTQPSDWVGLSVEQIPDYEGALVSDGKDDYGYADNLPIFKDYTVAIDRAWINLVGARTECLSIKNSDPDWGAFNFELSESIGRNTFSFGNTNQVSIDVDRKISYQSKYSYNGAAIVAGNIVDGKDLFLFRNRSAFPYYAEAAIWSYLLFPYSLSEFLLERQLKRYKLGTLYPGMIEWRPKVNINVPVVTPPTFSINNGSDIITNGQYIPEGTEITIRIFTATDSSVVGINEATAKINGVDIKLSPSGNKTYYGGKFIVSSKQKIDITIDEYIRYEDIVQPYPAIINLKQDGKTITWGDKLKVGSDIVFVRSANLLPELYTVSETRYNGVTLYPNTIIKVEKSMVFDNARTYLKANEPSCILSPNRLRIPNSSYKILGYIPDLTGKGNHGIINNSAYAGMSGANGYKYDWNTYTSHIAGVKPTDNAFKVNLTAETSTTALFGTPIFTVGSKSHYFRFKISGLINNQKIQIDYPKGNDDTVITSDRFGNGEYSTKDYTVGEVKRLNFYVINAVKGEPINVSIEQLSEYESSFCLDGVDDFVTIPTLAHGAKQVLMKVNLQSYDRYLYDQRNSWSQYLAIVSAGKTIAYEYSNKGGKTYIDGILNEHIIDKDLLNITHNITATNANIEVQYAPNIGTSFARDNFAQMALFDFMLFPEISSEDEIKKLNDVMGIEGGYVESPNYYYDAYGKKNTDTDRNLIADQ